MISVCVPVSVFNAATWTINQYFCLPCPEWGVHDPENWRVSDYLSPSWILKHSYLSLSCWACFPPIHRWRSWHPCHSNCLHTPLTSARKESDLYFTVPVLYSSSSMYKVLSIHAYIYIKQVFAYHFSSLPFFHSMFLVLPPQPPLLWRWHSSIYTGS